MDHRSSNSPGPPDYGLNVFATDMDSQESATMQNALKPLPDTQPESQDSQRISPNTFITAPNPPPPLLFSRPTHSNADDDISAGYQWAKPKETKPGQFSKRQNTRAINPDVEPPVKGSDTQLQVEKSRDQAAAFQGAPAIRARQAVPTRVAPSQESSEMDIHKNDQAPQTAQRPTLQMLSLQENDLPNRPSQNAQRVVPPKASSRASGLLQNHQPPQSAQRTDLPDYLAVSDDGYPTNDQQGRQPMQLTVPGVEYSAFNPQGHDSPQSHQRLQNVQDNPAQPSRESHIGKKSRFPDYEPTYRSPNPRKQLAAPVPPPNSTHSSPIVPRSGRHLELGQDVAVHHSHHPQQMSSRSPPQGAQQKSRASFQNDISVYSAQPPQKMPALSPSVNMVNRPLKNGCLRRNSKTTPTERTRSGGSRTQSGGSNTRSSIVRSNSKAKRSPTSQASCSSRASSSTTQRRFRGDETPPTRRSVDSGPQDLLKRQFAVKFHTATADISASLNSNFSALMEEADKHLATIDDLKHRLKQQKGKMSSYKEQVQEKDGELQQLEGERGQLLAEVQAKDVELEKTSSRISKLEGKCAQYKDYLNSAIAEQQALYKASKAKCDGAVAEMRVEENKRRVLQEREHKHVEDVREKLSQLVKSTVTEYKEKEREFHDKIETLNQRIQERDADVIRERETAQALLQQNGNMNSIQDTLKAFGAQIEEVLGKVDAVVASQHKQDDESAKATNAKLDQIMQNLRLLDERTIPSADVTKEMQEMNAQTVTSILEKLEPILTVQNETKASLNALTVEIARSVDDLWESLEDRQSVIEEYCDQQMSERGERINVLQSHVEKIEQELAHQNELFFNSEETLRKREATIEELELEITELTQAQNQSANQKEHLEQLRTECAKLKDDATAQGSLVSKLQGRLQATTAKLTTEEQKHQEHVEELRKLLEQQVAEAKTAQVQAVEAAQQESMLKMNAIKADLDAQLNRAFEERAALRLQLDAAIQKIASTEAEGSTASDKASNLEKELLEFRAEAAKDKEHASVQVAEQQATKEQQLKNIENLKSQLGQAEEKFKALTVNAISYDRAAQTVLASLKEWAKNYSAIQSMAKDLAKDLRKNGTKDGLLEGFDARFKPLVEMQLLLTAVSRYCQSQKEAAQMLSGGTAVDTQTQTFPTAELAAGSVLARISRVTIRSPALLAPSPKPPSVQIEQERRRVGEQPRSILKATTYVQQNRDDDSGAEVARNYTSMNRGPYAYNRLVMGSSDRSGTAADVETQKRKQGFGQESERKRRNGSKSGFPLPTEQGGQPDIGRVPGAPRKAVSSQSTGVIRDRVKQPASPLRFSQSSDDEPRRINSLPRDDKQFYQGDGTPLSVFFERRRVAKAKEHSQQSQQHSQDVDDRDHSQELYWANNESQESHVFSQDVDGSERISPLIRS